MTLLIADSGSTKTDWAYVSHDVNFFTTQGLNPNYLSVVQVEEVLKNQVLPHVTQPLTHVFFYGAGLGNENAKKVLYNVFKNFFSSAELHIFHDILGAAKAAYNPYESGIICIMGTGSIAGMYDGNRIIRTTGGLGYLLGDEGSGTYLGKLLIIQYVQQNLPKELQEALQDYIQIKPNETLHFLYQQQYPSRFLASLSYFIASHRFHPLIQSIIYANFHDFYARTLLPLLRLYPFHDRICCVGSIADIFQNELKSVMTHNHVHIQKIISRPIFCLVEQIKNTLL
ncbi:MAG: hypothetical protein NZ519_11700 [Bacteroidia bacterium]|nr:hypothetical protein [Bacteroidia bacterium]MDW8302812.1 hypothetical protein [Bacteroidia bacterium]